MSRSVAVVAAALLISCTAAPTAHADDVLQGVFDANTKPASVWAISTDCTPICVARVKSSDGWQSFAALTGGTWSLSVYRGTWRRSSYAPNPADCVSAGSAATISQTFTWSAADLTGAVETVTGDQCGGPSNVDHSPFRLSQRN